MSEETTTEQLVEIEGQTEDTPATEYTPPEGWRVLAVGERLRDGDVTVRRDGYQYPTERVGGWVGSNQRYIRPIEPEPQPVNDWPSVRDLRHELKTVQTQLGESRQRVTQLEELVGSLRTINRGCENAVRDAGKENTDLKHRLETIAAEWHLQAGEISGLQTQLAAVKAELVTQAETSRRLRIELDAAQQVPPAIVDRFQEGWNQGTARAVETIAEWLEPIRLVDSAYLANATMQHLPQIMRHLTGLDSHAID